MLLWAAFVWGLGSDTLSEGQTSSRFIGPLIDWLFPDLSPDARYAVHYGIRKSAHLTEYALSPLPT